MFDRKINRILVTLILTFGLVYLIYLTRFIFEPVSAYLAAIAVPIIGAGIIFYVTNPLVDWLEKKKIARIWGTLIVFFLILLVLALFVLFIAPTVQGQFTNFTDSVPKMVDSTEKIIDMWQERQFIIPQQVEDTINNILDQLGNSADVITAGIINTIGQVFSFVFSFFLIPFFLFFMLKDGHKFVPFITKFLKPTQATSFKKLTSEVNNTLSSFIQGQFIVSICVGTMLYIGYLIIDLNYSLSLALFGLVMNFIPFIGPFLSAVPAVIVGFFQDPIIALWAIAVMVVAQQIESNFISPNIMGRALSLHPLTVITLILAAGGIAGFLGVLFIIPAYAVVKTVIAHFYDEWKKRQPEDDTPIL
ncbi:putative PurR-regulated permease PerM [Gracilibacillus halotolerans]|uniref:Putative PurR-regulated permease PerM n=1 Tax=Gracilibacillus halotolerans TaxID=74386 RepID=A0A841RPE2_9BACI|nr:AI-2E family transporter [Gracilibacillus halotolerans]MBB6513045.1 putative PurR-regulated permease PerM [Gracilibacillus halotolerans]